MRIGKNMKWIRDTIDKIMGFILTLLFGTNSKFGKKYGISFDNNITLSSLPSPMPTISDFYEPVNENLIFEVMDTSLDDNSVSIREVGTDTIYKIDAELFIMIFVLKEPTKVIFNTLK